MTVRQLSIAATALGVVAVILFILDQWILGVVFILLSGGAWTMTHAYGHGGSPPADILAPPVREGSATWDARSRGNDEGNRCYYVSVREGKSGRGGMGDSPPRAKAKIQARTTKPVPAIVTKRPTPMVATAPGIKSSMVD
jgi:hypothetical protein